MTPSCCDCKRAFEPDEPVYRMRWRRAASGRVPGRVNPNLCASCAGADNPRPRHHWGWGDDWVTRTSCLECDRPIYQRERHTRLLRFCSHACLMTHQIKRQKELRKERRHKTRRCEHCNKEFPAVRADARTCSTRCRVALYRRRSSQSS